MGTLRFLLALAVVISHCMVFGNATVFGASFIGSYLAVRSFFIISGFYMWLILHEKYVGQNGSYRLFITNRFLRLYPAYWVVLIATVVVAVVEGIFFKQIPNRLSSFVAYTPLLHPSTVMVLIFSNLFIFGQDIICFLGFAHTGGFIFTTHSGLESDFMLVPQSWSLSLELFFYLMVPFIARKNSWLSIGLIIICAVAELVAYLHGYNNVIWNYRCFPFAFAFFLLGGICYEIYKKIKDSTFSNPLLTGIWAVLCLVIIFYQYLPGDDAKLWVYTLLFAMALPFIFYLTKNYKWDRYVGELSYPLYLVHVLVILVLKYTDISNTFSGITAIICSTLAAMVLYHYVTIPVERIRQSRVKVKKNKDAAMPVSWKG